MRHRGKALLVQALLLSALAWAVTPQFWENFTQEELLKGTLTRVSLGPDGKLFMAPAYDLVFDTNQPYIFSMARDKAGNLYVGTGHEGKVFRIDPQGKGSLYFQSGELDVFALALDANDTLYVGTSPDGKIYKVSGQGKSTEYCNPEEKYIWSMVLDDAGNLYAGTGGKGIIYRVDSTGKKSTFYDGDDIHIVSLLRSSSGNLIAGTSPGGLILDINPQGKAFTLLDSPMDEIRALTLDRFGTLFAVAASSKGLSLPAAPKKEPAAGGSEETLPLVTLQVLGTPADKPKEIGTSVSAPGGEKDASGAKSAVYAVDPDGGTETLYTSSEQMIYDLLVRHDGTVLAASGGRGRLLSIDPAKQVTVVTDSPEEQATRLLPANDDVIVAGSNQGKVYRLRAATAETGTFESRVLDARTSASWGRMSWVWNGPEGASVELASRSGNTEKPDSSWSDWSRPYTSGAGQQISSPKARYFQWKASFRRGAESGAGRAAGNLERVSIAYLQQNLRPQIVNITVLPPGVALQKNPLLPGSTLSISTTGTNGSPINSPRERGKEKQPLPPRQVAQPGAQAFTWKASDDNDDSLEYSIYFRGEGESDWKLIEKKLTDTFYTLEGGSLPDGVYTFKVVASDAPSNPYGKFLIGELSSKPFVVSNSTPSVEISSHKITGRRVEVHFEARAGAGRVSSAEFSIDGGEWFLLFPRDGVADSTLEEFEMSTSELSAGEHIIGLRAADATGNTGTTKLVVRIQ